MKKSEKGSNEMKQGQDFFSFAAVILRKISHILFWGPTNEVFASECGANLLP